MLAYLSRYTHRVAIANSRLLALDAQGVTFKFKDYRAKGGCRYARMSPPVDEFMRRFLLHALARGMHRKPSLVPKFHKILQTPGVESIS